MSETEEYIKTTRSKIIYRRVNAPLDWNKQSNFIPTWDNADHFNFACANCKTPADVLTVDFTPKMRSPPNTKTSTLIFILRCPKCNTIGIRKIHLEYPKTTVAWHTAFDPTTNRIYTINGTQPVAYSQIIAENLEKIPQQPKLKTVNVEIDLETLTTIWDNRQPNENTIDAVIERFIVEGLKTEGVLP